ncbi:hypothetical protein P7C73_g4972, partial [Tremellales sp. Uapishka_1]
MPSILARFKKSPSQHSDRRSSSTSLTSSEHSTHGSSRRDSVTAGSPRLGKSNSNFVENLDDFGQSGAVPLLVPDSAASPGTPKLVLTSEGSNSPRSLDSSPVIPHERNGKPRLTVHPPSVSSGDFDDLQTPTVESTSLQRQRQYPSVPQAMTAQAPLGGELPSGLGEPTTSPSHDARDRSASLASRHINDNRDRSGSLVSATSVGSSDSHHHIGAMVHRVAEKLAPSSPNISSNSSLKPVDRRRAKRDKKDDRRLSVSSIRSGHSSIATALAKSGLHIAGPIGHPEDLSAKSVHSSHNRASSASRSPFLVRSKKDKEGTEFDEDGEALDPGYDYEYDDDDDDDDDDDGSDYNEPLPVSGFAVASNRRNADFHALFSAVDEGDYLIEDYGCALSKDILVQGRLYVSENHICFHANIFGWVTDVVLPFADITVIEKKMTALVIPNAIQVVTPKSKHTFASFISRDTTYDVMMNIWRLSHPNAVMSTTSLFTANTSRPGSVHGDPGIAKGAVTGGKGHAPTQCICLAEGKHYKETALNAIFPGTPEKIYNLMFASGWAKTFLSDDQKLRDIQSSDWKPISSDNKLLTRNMSYIKPLNGSIGPKQTRCDIVDEQEHYDEDQYIVMLTTTRTPDVPSGGVFSVKTRTCYMWAGANSTKVMVTTEVEWTGKSWVKGLIEKSCIEGQKQFHDDMEAGMRQYIKEHPTEFAGEGGVEEEETAFVELDKDQPTAAEAYAADARRKRQEEDYTYLQGALDAIVTGFKAIFTGLKTLFDTIVDMLSDAPFTKETFMGLLIFVLVISNIYTYLIAGPKDAAKRERRLGQKQETRDLAEAMRLFLAGAGPREVTKAAASTGDEARALMDIIQDVERRAEKLKELLASAAKSGGERIASLVDLD